MSVFNGDGWQVIVNLGVLKVKINIMMVNVGDVINNCHL